MAMGRVTSQSGWTLKRVEPVQQTGKRRAGKAESPVIPAEFLQSNDVAVEGVFDGTPKDAAARRGRATPPDLAVDVELAPGEEGLIAIRHPSGALTFHPSAVREARSARRGGRSGTVAKFRVPIRGAASESGGGRRGVISKAVKVVVMKIAKKAVDKAISVALPKLVALWEKRTWSKKKLEEGWFRVTPIDGNTPGLRLTAAIPSSRERSLLLVHGTFSNAASGFGKLAGTDFFDRVRPLYGDRIFAFNHFSLSRTPDENARQLLSALSAGPLNFDVITHSRGGLVLRSLVERRDLHGALADRFRLGHAVLVASPNDGTPLATPTRWENTVGWFANLMEVFPDNPFTTGAEFVSEALVWLASHLAGDLPGLRSMDGAGEMVADLQSPPGPPDDAYSALVTNFHADEGLFNRALDIGVDAFFGSANDLVVPSEGGWRIDRDGAPHIPANRIGCFGPGGNITTGVAGPVHHVNFFGRAETAQFLARALAGQPQALSAIDPNEPLPDRRFARRSRSPGTQTAEAVGTRTPSPPRATATPPTSRPAIALSAPQSVPARDDVDTFHIVVMDYLEPLPAKLPAKKKSRTAKRKRNAPATKPRTPRFARVFASYGGARVTRIMRLRADLKDEIPIADDRVDEHTLFGDIIGFHEQVKNYTNREKGSLPSDSEMIVFGSKLFETLFQGDVRRLYDEARTRERGRKLDIVLTSMIPWIGEKPWEFAFDDGRKSFLATEDIHFVRNVLTNVPADSILQRDGPLRILVASAQPVGFGRLSIDQERGVIRRGFEPLIDAGLVTVDSLARATPERLHDALKTGRYSVVHFIGHGVFDEEKGEGCLVFEDERGGEYSLGERSIREIFCGRGLSLVFLNACQSGTGGRADFNKGVAQALVSHGLPALVANQYSVLDSSATSFAQHFYLSLAQGLTLGESAREARIAVNYSLHGDLIDWAVPVLYARDANATLCAPPKQRISVPTTSVRSASRRAVRGRPIRVGVWDIDDAFPALERTLDQFNAAQTVFGFEHVDISPPLDVWDLEADEKVPYLWAERLAKRVQSKTVELRVNVLACVTRHYMRDDGWLNLYGWWPEGGKPPVVIFSCAGMDKLPAAGPMTDRVIANVMVTTLAGFFGDVSASHNRAPKNCPMYFNAERDFRHMAGQQRFDPQCRKLLSKKLKGKLSALEALLKPFAGA